MASDDVEKAYHEANTFVEVFSRLAHEIRESRKASTAMLQWFQEQKSGLTPKHLEELKASLEAAIIRTESKIMSQLSDFADRVETQFGTISTSVDSLVTGVSGIDADVQGLKKLIADLQASPGAVTPEDQGRLDKLEAGLAALSQKTAVAAQMVKTLDDATADAPTPDPEPPAEGRTR